MGDEVGGAHVLAREPGIPFDRSLETRELRVQVCCSRSNPVFTLRDRPGKGGVYDPIGLRFEVVPKDRDPAPYLSRGCCRSTERRRIGMPRIEIRHDRQGFGEHQISLSQGRYFAALVDRPIGGRLMLLARELQLPGHEGDGLELRSHQDAPCKGTAAPPEDLQFVPTRTCHVFPTSMPKSHGAGLGLVAILRPVEARFPVRTLAVGQEGLP